MNREDEINFLRLMGTASVPSLLLSGGEPLRHPNFFELLARARELGLNAAVSTNGTLVDERAAESLAMNSSYVGISVDGPRSANDEFRGMDGAYDASLRAVSLLASNGCRVGLRVTLASPILKWLGEIFAIAESLPISRICFYRFMPSGRGSGDASLVPAEDDEGFAVDRIIEWADRNARSGARIEALTVGDGSDNVRLYKYLVSRPDGRAESARELMARSASVPGGSGILSVRWDGAVFRNQFMWGQRLGGWRELEDIARRYGTGELALECLSCRWVGKICGGRIRGFGRECTQCETAA
jgi:MoaA/NifB/PqqE/SkfB family radical SAM enzyme